MPAIVALALSPFIGVLSWIEKRRFAVTLNAVDESRRGASGFGCRTRPPYFDRAQVAELAPALAGMRRGKIEPVDLAQAEIGPGMAVYTRFAEVLDAEGKPPSVREGLSRVNQTLDGSGGTGSLTARTA